MSDSRDQDLQDEHSARPSAQDARQGRNGPQILIVLCASVGLLVSAYLAMLVFAGG
jgi:hypothetical protein